MLYLVPICFIGWTLGRTSSIAFSVLALAAWFTNNHVISHLLPHSFLLCPYSFPRLWKALVLLATWVAFVIVLDRLKTALARADERFVTVLEGLPEAVYVVDPKNGDLLYLSSRCRNTFGTDASLTHARQIDAQLQPPPSHDQARDGEVFDAAHQR